MLGTAQHGDKEITVQAELFAAIFKRERGALDLPGLWIEDLSTGPSTAILHKSRKYLQAYERTVFQVTTAEIAGGMRDRRVKELLNGSVELSVLFADRDDARYLAGCVVDGLPSAHRRRIGGIRRAGGLCPREGRKHNQHGEAEKQNPRDEDAKPGKLHELRLRAGN
jgi:hypothetical protein